MGRHESNAWYTIYEAYMDKLVVIGTAKECASYMGISLTSFYEFVSRVKNGVVKTHTIAIEDPDCEKSYRVYGENNTGRITRGPTIDYEAVEELYGIGMSDADISRRLDIAPERVWYWRKKNNLPPLGKRGRKKKVHTPDTEDFDLMKEVG